MKRILKTKTHREDMRSFWIEIDLAGERACGDLTIHWAEHHNRSFEIQSSGDGMLWHTAYTAENQQSTCQTIALESTENRMLRILAEPEMTERYAIRSVELDSSPASEATARFREAARRNPGCYPRWLSNQQAYWTLCGSPNDAREGALCEDGTLEPFKRGFTIMPLLHIDKELFTRENAEVTQSLADNWMPVPSVHWNAKQLDLDITLVSDLHTESTLFTRYTLTNRNTQPVSGMLYLVFHPIQVYPPWQFNTDGFAPITSISYQDGTATVNRDHTVHFQTHPSVFAIKTSSHASTEPAYGDIADDVVLNRLPVPTSAGDGDCYSSGVAGYAFSLQPGQTVSYVTAIPLHQSPAAPLYDLPDEFPAFDELLRKSEDYWSSISNVKLDLPDDALANMWQANTAYNLVTMDDGAFQPGSRSYDKAWMRDGAVAAMAMLRMGRSEEVRTFIAFMAQYQQDSGEIPPIIDTKHEDPLWEEKELGLQEFDSQGEFVHLIYEYVRFTKDYAFLESIYPQVRAALQFTQHLREQRCTPEFRKSPEKQEYYNILPPSRSHEGYFLAHSYWDNFWALAGWKSGGKLADLLGKTDDAEWMQDQYEQLKTGVYESIARVMARDNINYLPGCAEQGDYDPGSTAAAITYCGELNNLPPDALQATFDRYCERLARRLVPDAEYSLTPYEIRIVPALLQMGRKKQALELLNFLLNSRRPKNWYHLAEVINSDPRFPCYIGDMPHTWVGAGFVIACRSLFAYEDGERLIVGAGFPAPWLKTDQAIRLKNLPTYFGQFHISFETADRQVTVHIEGQRLPEAGIVLHSPLDKPVEQIKLITGQAELKRNNTIEVTALPVSLSLIY